MKKLIFLFAFCIVVTNVFAQTAPEQLKKEGNDAFNAKNYPVAYAKFSEYLKQTNNQDSATAYYCGIAADEVKKYAEAVTFFDIAIQKKFNIGNAYARKALALDALKKTDEYVATLEEGLKVDPNNKTMIKNYGLHYLKAGLAAQKAGKAEEAEECFKKVIPLDHKSYKTNALYSLGVLCYNDGANILKKATPLANSDADKYAAEKEKATARFKEALGYLEEAAKVSPDNPIDTVATLFLLHLFLIYTFCVHLLHLKIEQIHAVIYKRTGYQTNELFRAILSSFYFYH